MDHIQTFEQDLQVYSRSRKSTETLDASHDWTNPTVSSMDVGTSAVHSGPVSAPVVLPIRKRRGGRVAKLKVNKTHEAEPKLRPLCARTQARSVVQRTATNACLACIKHGEVCRMDPFDPIGPCLTCLQKEAFCPRSGFQDQDPFSAAQIRFKLFEIYHTFLSNSSSRGASYQLVSEMFLRLHHTLPASKTTIVWHHPQRQPREFTTLRLFYKTDGWNGREHPNTFTPGMQDVRETIINGNVRKPWNDFMWNTFQLAFRLAYHPRKLREGRILRNAFDVIVLAERYVGTQQAVTAALRSRHLSITIGNIDVDSEITALAITIVLLFFRHRLHPFNHLLFWRMRKEQ